MSKTWFETQFEKWGFDRSQWFMAHEEVAKIKCIPSFQKTAGKGKIILVTAMSPTPFGEGKTTSVIALTDALNQLGKNALATLRQPSVGPVFGKKGGATGGGKATVIPQDRIDLGLSGDFYGVENANNMIAALIDNHIYHNLEPHLSSSVLWRRCLDMNDRTLRSFNAKEGKRGFVITAASELMAILSLSRNFGELKEKIGRCILALDHNQKLITAKDLDFHKAAAVLLRDAFYPNLVKTLEGNPVIMHAGPFANIAQGTNSIIATAVAKHLGDYVVTEAGFGAELGAEKFFNIKCRLAEFDVACSVIVATTRAIEKHGMENLLLHIENLQAFGPPVVVCLNKFPDDTSDTLIAIKNKLEQHSIACEVSEGFEKGGAGALDLAKRVVEMAQATPVKFSCDLKSTIQEKVESIAKKIYRAKHVDWSQKALEKVNLFSAYSDLPICMAKTPLSIGDNVKCDFIAGEHTIHIRDLKLQAGAGFIVVLTGEIHLMPGLPKDPKALQVDLTEQGKIQWH